jgi:hypothetical protein
LRALENYPKTQTVLFISASAHQKFVSQCRNLVLALLENKENPVHVEVKTQQLKEDLARLQYLAESYMDKHSRLSELSREYDTLQRSIRVNMRKIMIDRNNVNK